MESWHMVMVYRPSFKPLGLQVWASNTRDAVIAAFDWMLHDNLLGDVLSFRFVAQTGMECAA